MIFTIVCAFLFIIKCRKYDENINEYIRRKYNEHTYKTSRCYQNTLRKLTKCELDIDFLIHCKTYNVIPKFLRFKLYKKSLQSAAFYRKWQTKLLNNELQCKKKTKDKLTAELAQHERELKVQLSLIDFLGFKRFISKINNSFTEKTRQTHKKKLNHIGIDSSIKPCDPNSVIFNYTSIILPQRIKFLLAFGLEFCLPIFKIDYYSYFCSLEKIVNSLKSEACTNNTEFIDNLRSLAFKYFYNFNPSKIFSVFTKEDIANIRNFSSNNKNIIVTRPDKGRGVVLVNKDTYINSMLSIIADDSKFKEIKDPIHKYTVKIESKINRFLGKLKNLNIFSSELYNKLYVSGSGPGVLYGLPKIHKPDFSTNFQFRPIFAAYNTPSFSIAKFLVPILSNLTMNEYTLKNSYEFVQQLTELGNADEYVMASFDVQNLFTNIPLHETIDIILKQLFTSPTTTVIGLTCNFFKSLLELSVLNSFFLFNGKYYQQTEGLGMGLPLGPSFANIFMCYHEIAWLRDCPNHFKPQFYRRYVDDTFLLFRDKTHVASFLNYLNAKHCNIKFTMEYESNLSISFLDCQVKRLNNKFSCSVYRKESFTGLGTSMFSYCSYIFKINSIKTLIFRSYKICSDYFSFHDELNFLLKYFRNNGYTSSMVHKQINIFLSRMYDNSSIANITHDKTLYFSFPFFGYQSEKLKSDISKLITKYYPNIKVNLVLTNNFTINSFFNHKDKLPFAMRSSLVYLYSCAQCASEYVGMTTRTLGARVAEHRGRGYTTDNVLSTPSHSAIRIHSEQCSGLVSLSDFKILRSSNSFNSLFMLESLYIHKRKPVLNNQYSSYNLAIVNR